MRGGVLARFLTSVRAHALAFVLVTGLVFATAPAASAATPDASASRIQPMVRALQRQAESLEQDLVARRDEVVSATLVLREAAQRRAVATQLEADVARVGASLSTFAGVGAATERDDHQQSMRELTLPLVASTSAAEERAAAAVDAATDRAADVQRSAGDARRRADALRAAVAGWRGTLASGSASAPTHGWGAPGTRAVSAASLDEYLTAHASPIAGQGTTLVAAGLEHDVDPRLIVAIAGAESQFGLIICAPNNAWGWGCPTSPIGFTSWADGIEAVAAGLRSGYLDDGLTSVTAIHARYAPVAATNDPTGLNSAWATNVARLLVEQGGSPEDVTGPGGAGGAVSSS